MEYERTLLVSSNVDVNSDSKAHCLFLLRLLKLKLSGLMAERFVPTK